MLNGVQFKKGALVFLIIHTIHHDSNAWPDPQEFNPDRYILLFKIVLHVINMLCMSIIFVHFVFLLREVLPWLKHTSVHLLHFDYDITHII